MNKLTTIYLGFILLLSVGFMSADNNPKIGQIIDSLDGVEIYYNGKINNVIGRNKSRDGYNLGLKWQCVEFVKRYYYEVYGHKMPDSYGHAKEFFNKDLPDVAYNASRGLTQYRNTRYEKPKKGDIIIYDAYRGNPFGHIGIISKVGKDHVIIKQQNVGKKSSQRLKLVEFNGIYTIADFDVLGWLRL